MGVRRIGSPPGPKARRSTHPLRMQTATGGSVAGLKQRSGLRAHLHHASPVPDGDRFAPDAEGKDVRNLVAVGRPAVSKVPDNGSPAGRTRPTRLPSQRVLSTLAY